MNVYSEDNPPPKHAYYYDEEGAADYCECGKWLENDPPWFTWGHHLRDVVEELPGAAWDDSDRICATCNLDAPDDGSGHANLTYAPAPEED